MLLEPLNGTYVKDDIVLCTSRGSRDGEKGKGERGKGSLDRREQI